MTVLGVGIETAATMDSEPVIMVPGEPQTQSEKNQVDRFPISLMQSSSTMELQTKGTCLYHKDNLYIFLEKMSKPLL